MDDPKKKLTGLQEEAAPPNVNGDKGWPTRRTRRKAEQNRTRRDKRRY